MEKYNIQKVMVTIIYMERIRLITKEKMENYCKGKKSRILSVNDDLETLLENIQFGKESDDYAKTYFLPQLTEHELESVKRKDEDFMNTFFEMFDADLDKVEMAASESDSKYVQGLGERKTYTIENSSLKQKVLNSSMFKLRPRTNSASR